MFQWYNFIWVFKIMTKEEIIAVKLKVENTEMRSNICLCYSYNINQVVQSWKDVISQSTKVITCSYIFHLMWRYFCNGLFVCLVCLVWFNCNMMWYQVWSIKWCVELLVWMNEIWTDKGLRFVLGLKWLANMELLGHILYTSARVSIVFRFSFIRMKFVSSLYAILDHRNVTKDFQL